MGENIKESIKIASREPRDTFEFNIYPPDL
jgi:hypothetical protein